MKTVATILVAVLMLGTLGVLFAGLIGMGREGGAMRSNVLMRWRVLLQAAALGLVALLMALLRG